MDSPEQSNQQLEMDLLFQEGIEDVDDQRIRTVCRILAKIDDSIRVNGIVRGIAHNVTELARMGMDAVPFGRWIGKKKYDSLKGICERVSGSEYSFDPNELFIATIKLLIAQGKFDQEEIEFLRANEKILMRMFNSKIDKKLLERDTAKDIPAKIKWDRMHARELLDTDLFAMLEMSVDEFNARYENPLIPKTEEERVVSKKVQFSVDLTDEGITPEILQQSILRREEKLCRHSNEILRRQVELYSDGNDSCETDGLLTRRVAEAKDDDALYAILDEFEELYHSYQTADSQGRQAILKRVEELDMARRKLLVYQSASTLTRNPQYRYRESVKTYLDTYFITNIFKITGETTVSPKGYPHIHKKVLTAQLTDPLTRESVQVYLYPGMNSDKPEEGNSGIVNIKALYKVVMKDLLLDEKEVRDFFRITVMPVNPAELDEMRRVLSTTITNPQGLTKETIREKKEAKDNKATAYRDKDIVNYDSTITSYVRDGETLKPLVIPDIHQGHEGELVHVGAIDLEIRTGTVEDLVPEDESISHKAYSKMRMEPVWRKLYNPDHYTKNWVSKVYIKQNALKASTLDPNGRILPGFLATNLQNCQREVAEENLSGINAVKEFIRRGVVRYMVATEKARSSSPKAPSSLF